MATIDDIAENPSLVGVEIDTSGTKIEQFERIDAAKLLEQARDYSHFSNWKNSMRFDAKKERLESTINYASQLIRYAKRNLNGSSKGKVERLSFVREYLTSELNTLLENGSQYLGSYKASNGRKKLPDKLDYHKARVGRMHTIPLSGPYYEKHIKPYLTPTKV